MKIRLFIVLCMCALVLPLAARAEGALSLRLIEAEAQETTASAEGLEDLKPLLGQLPLKSFALAGAHTIKLPAPAGTVVALPHGLSVTLEGPATDLKVKVMRGTAKVIDTTLSLRTGSPFVQNVGTAGPKTLIVALVAQ